MRQYLSAWRHGQRRSPGGGARATGRSATPADEVPTHSSIQHAVRVAALCNGRTQPKQRYTEGAPRYGGSVGKAVRKRGSPVRCLSGLRKFFGGVGAARRRCGASGVFMEGPPCQAPRAAQRNRVIMCGRCPRFAPFRLGAAQPPVAVRFGRFCPAGPMQAVGTRGAVRSSLLREAARPPRK